MPELAGFFKKALVNTTAASAFFTGGLAPAPAAMPDSAGQSVQSSSSASYDPVNGQDAPLFPLSAVVHMGGMHGMMDSSAFNIFHYLASLPEEERVLRVGVITQPQIPELVKKYDVRDDEYAPVNKNTLARTAAVMDQFTAITGIPVEIVPGDMDAPVLVGAYSDVRINRQREEQKSNPDMVVAAGFAAGLDIQTKPHFLQRRLMMLGQSEGSDISTSIIWHEFGHVLGLAHSGDKHGTLGNWHDGDSAKSFYQTEFQQKNTSVMRYGSPLSQAGAVDVYLIHQAMEREGLTPPPSTTLQTDLAGTTLPAGKAHYDPADIISVSEGSTLRGTNQSDLLVSEEGLCGVTRYEAYRNGNLYCVVEGNYSHVQTSGGDDLVITSRLKEQTIELGRGDHSVALIDKDSGEKTIRLDTHGDGGDALVLSEDMLNGGKVNAHRQDDSVILDFIHDGKCTTRITLVDQLKEGEKPPIGSIKVLFGVPDTYVDLPVEIDINKATSPEDFESLFNEQMKEYSELAQNELRTGFASEEEFRSYLTKNSSQEEYGENIRRVSGMWEYQKNPHYNQLRVIFQPPESGHDKSPLPTQPGHLAYLRNDQQPGKWSAREALRQSEQGADVPAR